MQHLEANAHSRPKGSGHGPPGKPGVGRGVLQTIRVTAQNPDIGVCRSAQRGREQQDCEEDCRPGHVRQSSSEGRFNPSGT